MAKVVSAGGQKQLGRAGGGLGVSDLQRARRVLGYTGMTVRRHATRSPYSFAGDTGVLYIGEGDTGEGEVPLLRAAVSCPKAGAAKEQGEGLGKYLDGLAREALGAAAEVEEAEAAYYEAGAYRDDGYRGRKGRGARLGQHFGPSYLRRSPVVGLLVCDFEVPSEVLDRLVSSGPDPGSGAVAVAHPGGIRLAGPHREGATQIVVLEREACLEGGEEAPEGLARRGREAEYLSMRDRLMRPPGARVARLLLALRPTRVDPLVGNGEEDVLEALKARAGVGHSGLLLGRAMVDAGYAKRRRSTKRIPGGAVWMSAKMRTDTAAALADALSRAIVGDSAYAPETLVCRPADGETREEWLAGLRARMGSGGERPGEGVQRRSQRQAQGSSPKLAFGGAAAAAAYLAGAALEAPAPGEPLRMVVVGGGEVLPTIAATLGLEPLDVEEEETGELPGEVVMLSGYPDTGVLIDAQREEGGPLSLASPAQMLIDLYLYPHDCAPEYLEGLKTALGDLL